MTNGIILLSDGSEDGEFLTTAYVITFLFEGCNSLGKSMGNPRVSGAIPIPNLPKNPYPLCGYRFSNGYASGDLYSYLCGFTHRYEQVGSICQQACVHSQMVTLRV